MRGFNDDELCDFANFTLDRNVDVRFIEYMPFNGNGWNDNSMVPFEEMMSILKVQYPSIFSLKNDASDTAKVRSI